MKECVTNQELIYKTKPCPFCQGRDQEVTAKQFWDERRSGLISIDCTCGCELNLFTDPTISWEDAVEEVVDKWNDRGWEEDAHI